MIEAASNHDNRAGQVGRAEEAEAGLRSQKFARQSRGSFLGKRALDLDDAEALAGLRLHHHRALERARDLGAEPLEPRNLRGDVVGLELFGFRGGPLLNRSENRGFL
jgi:hypothetical protein